MPDDGTVLSKHIVLHVSIYFILCVGNDTNSNLEMNFQRYFISDCMLCGI